MDISICVAASDKELIQKLYDSICATITPTKFLVRYNSSSIVEAYNDMAKSTDTKYLVFCHQDIEVQHSKAMWQRMLDLLDKPSTAFVGPAGARVLSKDAVWWSDLRNLSGTAFHSDNTGIWSNAYGPFGQVVVLDGVFLAIKKDTLEKIGGWDTKYTGFDFYDIGTTFLAHKMGLKNHTTPLMIIHRSLGDVSKRPNWHENRQTFLNLYSNDLPCIV